MSSCGWRWCSVRELAGLSFTRLRKGGTGLDLFECLAEASELGDDGIDSGCPYEWFRIFIPNSEKPLNGSDKIVDAAGRIATDGRKWIAQRGCFWSLALTLTCPLGAPKKDAGSVR